MKKFFIAPLLLLLPVFVFAGTTERIQLSGPSLIHDDAAGGSPSVSSDGRYVAFESAATDLVADDNNGVSDIFVYDRTNDTIERVSVDDNGVEGNGNSNEPEISADGRYVVFHSDATNFIADEGDGNGVTDIFVYDRTNDTIERVSVDDNGVEGNGMSLYPSLSPDGRYVAFYSDASNLVADDTNISPDVFVYDRDTDTVERVSVSDLGAEGDDGSYAPSISSDGRYVAFESAATNLVAGDENGFIDVFVYDRTNDTVERVSVDDNGTEGDSISSGASISSDGRYVVFDSEATNFVANDGDSNDVADVFIYDRTNDTIERVSVDDNGVEGNGGSSDAIVFGDGRYVIFKSAATNLVADDTNDADDFFLRDRTLGTTERISVTSSEEESVGGSVRGTPAISSNERYVAFRSSGNNLVSLDFNEASDVFVRDLTAGTTEIVSALEGTPDLNQGSHGTISVSSDGRYIAFLSDSTNLVAGDDGTATDVFVFDNTLNTIERVSVDDNGTGGSGNSNTPSISSDGRYVAFYSQASNFVAGDNNAVSDVFVYDRTNDTIERVSVDSEGSEGDDASFNPSISGDGRYVAFESDASNLIFGELDANPGQRDIFVYDRDLDVVEQITQAVLGIDTAVGFTSPSISEDGQFVAYLEIRTVGSGPGQTVTQQIFVYDRETDSAEAVSINANEELGNGYSSSPAISSDGRYVTFDSNATNLIEDDTNESYDIFVYDRTNDTIERVSIDDNGVEGNGNSQSPSISLDGRYVAFQSYASNLIVDDTNDDWDVFVYDRTNDTVERANVDNSGEEGNDYVCDYTTPCPAISGDGRYVVYDSPATNLVADDTNGYDDVFIYDRGEPSATLTVTTTVTNNDGGTAVADDFALTLGGLDIASGVATTTSAGTYTVAVSGPATYTTTIGGDCATDGSVTMSAGETYTCTVTADDVAQEEEDNGGGGGSFRNILKTPPLALTTEEAVKSVLNQLIIVLQQLITLLVAQR